MQRVEVGAWMKAEILHQVLPRSALVMAMPARMQQQNVAIADVCARALDDLRRDHGPVRHLGGNIDHHPPVHQIIERQRGHVAFGIVGRVHGAVEMRADVKRGLDPLRDNHLCLQVLRVVHPVTGVSDPARGMHVHHVAHVDHFHCLPFAL